MSKRRGRKSIEEIYGEKTVNFKVLLPKSLYDYAIHWGGAPKIRQSLAVNKAIDTGDMPADLHPEMWAEILNAYDILIKHIAEASGETPILHPRTPYKEQNDSR